MADKTQQKSIPVAAIVISLVVIGGLGAFWYLDKASRQPAARPVLTGDAKAYVRNLKLSDVSMQAKESYVKQSIVEITGKITNGGDHVLKTVKLNCVFYDAYGQLVLRELTGIVSRSFAPGETRDFRLAFDNIPESWNQSMPQLVIAEIIFA